jgi:hypothetical protein
MLSVVTPAAPSGLLNVPELRLAAGLADGSSDTTLVNLGFLVTEAIYEACRAPRSGMASPTLMAETLKEVFRPDRAMKSLVLSKRFVSQISSIIEDSITLPAAEYEFGSEEGIVYRLRNDALCYWEARKIEVTYTAGFMTPPAALKMAASKLVATLFSRTARDPNLKRLFIPGVVEKDFWVSPSNDPLITTEINDLLAPYTDMRFI